MPNKQKFWCSKVIDPDTGLGVALPWTVEYDKYNSGSLVPEEVSPGMMTRCSSATVFPASWTMRLISYWVA